MTAVLTKGVEIDNLSNNVSNRNDNLSQINVKCLNLFSSTSKHCITRLGLQCPTPLRSYALSFDP